VPSRTVSLTGDQALRRRAQPAQPFSASALGHRPGRAVGIAHEAASERPI